MVTPPNPKTGSASGTRGGFADSKNPNKLETSVHSKAIKRKQMKTDLTGKKIVEKWKNGHLANLVVIVGLYSRQIVVLIKKKANSMLNLFLELERGRHSSPDLTSK